MSTQLIKVGDIVRCIDPNSCLGLHINYAYTVLRERWYDGALFLKEEIPRYYAQRRFRKIGTACQEDET